MDAKNTNGQAPIAPTSCKSSLQDLFTVVSARIQNYQPQPNLKPPAKNQLNFKQSKPVASCDPKNKHRPLESPLEDLATIALNRPYLKSSQKHPQHQTIPQSPSQRGLMSQNLQQAGKMKMFLFYA